MNNVKIFLLLIIMLTSLIGQASKLTVTSIENDGVGSLRSALFNASRGDSIYFAQELNGLPIILESQIEIVNSILIFGNGQKNTIISGGGVTRVLYISSAYTDVETQLFNLSIIDGFTFGEGGGIYMGPNFTNLKFVNVYLEGNQALGPSGKGGGIYATGNSGIVIQNSQITHNTASIYGGGVFLDAILNCNINFSTVRDNLVIGTDEMEATVAGGAVYCLGSVYPQNSTISGNSCLSGSLAYGGAIAVYPYGATQFGQSTISGNTTSGKGGGIYIEAGQLSAINSTVTNNQASVGGGVYAGGENNYFSSLGSAFVDNFGDSLSVDIYLPNSNNSSRGYNLIGQDMYGHFTQLTTDKEGAKNVFSPLKNNGGKTLTHRPLQGSPVIDAGHVDEYSGLAPDQIGQPVYGGQREIGALEFAPPISWADFDGDGFGDRNVYAYGDVPPDNYITDDNTDNCPYVFNPSQTDENYNWIGDDCEGDNEAKDQFFLAAACSEVGERFIVRTNTSTGEVYAVYIGSASNAAVPPNEAQNRVRFVIPNAVAGDYNLFARIRAPNSSADSYWVRLNDGPWIKWGEGLVTTTFAWREVIGYPYSLRSGRNTIDFAYREPNIELEKIQLSIGGSFPTDGAGGAAYGCEPQVELFNQFYLEAECAEVGTNFPEYTASGASGGRYVKYTGTRSMDIPPADVPANRVRFAVINAAGGYYNFFARVRTPDGNADSFWIRVNGGDWTSWNKNLGTSVFAWKEIVGNSYLLTEGYNFIDIAYREPNTELDKLYFGIGGGLPTDTGPEASNLCD